jgi:hypothetical protein
MPRETLGYITRSLVDLRPYLAKVMRGMEKRGSMRSIARLASYKFALIMRAPKRLKDRGILQ